MAEKTTKKPTVKKSTVKKTTTKKTTNKKMVAEPVAEKHPCGCEMGCACGVHCTKNKCKFARFLKKFVLFVIIFALGFATAKMCCCDKRGRMGPRPEFNNGCLVIKCQKMMDMAPMMDTDNDGCVTKQEFKAAKKLFKKDFRKAAPEMPQEPEMAAPAPQVTE